MALNTQRPIRSLTLMGRTFAFDDRATATALKSLDEQARQIGETLAHVDERLTPTSEQGLLKAFEGVLEAHVKPPAPQPPSGMPLTLTEPAADRIRLLVQVQTLALDKHPGQPAKAGRRTTADPDTWGENITLAGLRKAAEQLPDNLGALQGDFDAALAPFRTVAPSERTARLAFVHDLIRRIASTLT